MSDITGDTAYDNNVLLTLIWAKEMNLKRTSSIVTSARRDSGVPVRSVRSVSMLRHIFRIFLHDVLLQKYMM